jgi:hypothetical protein
MIERRRRMNEKATAGEYEMTNVDGKKVIECKSSSVDGKPLWGDMLHLANQMKASGASEGELRYTDNKTFRFTHNSEEIQVATKQVLDLVAKMKAHLIKKMIQEALPTTRRCDTCTFSSTCGEGKTRQK